MRHRKKKTKLSLTRRHDNSILRNQAVSLILHEKISTTLAKAKVLRTVVENLITKAKKNDLSARRALLSYLPKEGAVSKMLEEIAPRYKERPGGYTRIRKQGQRKGDGAEVAQIELV